MYEKIVKRTFDILLSLLLLIILLPLMLVICVMVLIYHGSPAIFSQNRPGYHEKIFKMYKFRTMTNETDDNGTLLSDEIRLTKFGKLLRSLSLDELPQLFNILKGELSFIGPRALLVKYLPLYTEEQHRRHDVKPGLVGLAALHGRNNQDWESKFKYDIYYVDNISFKLDLKIFLGAIKVVLTRKGVSLDGEATTIPFQGTIKEEVEK